MKLPKLTPKPYKKNTCYTVVPVSSQATLYLNKINKTKDDAKPSHLLQLVQQPTGLPLTTVG